MHLTLIRKPRLGSMIGSSSTGWYNYHKSWIGVKARTHEICEYTSFDNTHHIWLSSGNVQQLLNRLFSTPHSLINSYRMKNTQENLMILRSGKEKPTIAHTSYYLIGICCLVWYQYNTCTYLVNDIYRAYSSVEWLGCWMVGCMKYCMWGVDEINYLLSRVS